MKSGDANADGALLADDFLGVYESGFATRSEHVSQLGQGAVVSSYEIEAPHLKALGPAVALLSYRATWVHVSGRRHVWFITSIWAQRDGEWLNIFSQDTVSPQSPRSA